MRREFIAIAIASLLSFVAGDALCTAAMRAPEGTLAKEGIASYLLQSVLNGALFSFDPLPLAIGLAAMAGVWFVWIRWWEKRGAYRSGEEHGSSRWAKSKEIAAFSDKREPDNNILLTENAKIRLIDSAHDQMTETNNNILVVGGPGTGKTRYFVKPNLLQANANFFITDPKGTLIHDAGWALAELGYEIRTFNTIDFSYSMHFNPISYIESEAGVLRFVECIIKNTTGDDQHTGDPFWENAEKLLYTALVSYLLDHCPVEDRCIPGLLQLLALADAREDDEDYLSPLDMIFNELESGMRLVRSSSPRAFDPESREFDNGGGQYVWTKVAEPVRAEDDFALSSYKQFKVAAGKTLKSIMVSCNVRMKPFDIEEVRELLSYDEMGFRNFGDKDKKIALFASMSDTDSTFDFIFALLMQQALDMLCQCALKKHKGSLPRCVHFVFDEFANIGTIPDFERMISVTRSRNIAVSMICQSLSQLKENYGDNNAETIINACDTLLYLGGKSNETNREIAEMAGKQTVATVSVNDSRGDMSSYSHNHAIVERDLIQPAEIARMPRDEALVLINGAMPFKDKKFRLASHSRKGLLDLADLRGPFDFKKYRMKRKEEASSMAAAGA